MPTRSTVSPENETHLILPKNKLRRKIGSDISLNKIFTKDKILSCQEMIDETLAEILREMEVQIASMGTEYIRSLNDQSQTECILKKITGVTREIRRRMESLNFTFGYQVAQSLLDYTQTLSNCNSDAVQIICKHVAVLNVVIKDKISGNGGKMEQDILTNLRMLVKKAQQQPT